MKAILLLLILSTCTILSFAQSTINYTFDKQGRIKSERIEGAYLLKFFYDKEGNIFFKTVDNITGLNELNASTFGEMVKVYPNPTSNNFAIEVLANEFNQEITLFDTSGKVLEKRFIMEKYTLLSLDNYVQGVYFLLIKSGSKTEQHKIIKI